MDGLEHQVPSGMAASGGRRTASHDRDMGAMDAAHPEAAYPPPARANEVRTRQGGSSRGSSNNKRTSLLSGGPTPPSTTKKNEAASAAAAAGTTLRRLVTPPIVARAMRDTPSTLQRENGSEHDGIGKGKEAPGKDPTTLECPGSAANSTDEHNRGRALLTLSSSQSQGMARTSSDKENVGASGQKNSSQADESKGIFSWTDAQLAQHYIFEKEIGFGNWGSVWLATPRKSRHAPSSTPVQQVAIKLVHRQGTPASNARVKAIWNETKVLRSCGKPTHENLVHFKEFVVTPSYALVVMDYYRQPMNVALPVSMYAGPDGYFHQLLDSINWLHERSVTHCDIKVANLLVDTSKDKLKGRPVLVDFGFATLHDSKTKFMSTQSWGTPEYLSPERNRGDLHDERLSDVWALGVTFFEIATGRTPFEHEDEQFLTKEQLDVYYRRTLETAWVGTWNIPLELEFLCRQMLAPDAKKRIYCNAALAHRFFRQRVPNDDIGDIDGSLKRELETSQTAIDDTAALTPSPTNEHDESQEAAEICSLANVDDNRAKIVSQTQHAPAPLNKREQGPPKRQVPAVPSKDDSHAHRTIVDAEHSITQASIDSEADVSSSRTSNAMQMLKAHFKRNKKRAAAYPPSAFSAAAKQQRGSTGSNRFTMLRRSSEGAAAALREHADKKKRHSSQEKQTSNDAASISPTGTRKSSLASTHTQLPVAATLFQADDHQSQAKTGTNVAVDMSTASSNATVPMLFRNVPTYAVEAPTKSAVTLSPKRKPLPSVIDGVSAARTTASVSHVHFDEKQRAFDERELSTSAREGCSWSEGHNVEPPECLQEAPDLSAEELTHRLAEMSVMTTSLVRMVKETQAALQKLQERSSTSVVASPSVAQAPRPVTKDGTAEGNATRASQAHPFAMGMAEYDSHDPTEVLEAPSPPSTVVGSDGHQTSLGVSSAILANQASWQNAAVAYPTNAVVAQQARLDYGLQPSQTFASRFAHNVAPHVGPGVASTTSRPSLEISTAWSGNTRFFDDSAHGASEHHDGISPLTQVPSRHYQLSSTPTHESSLTRRHAKTQSEVVQASGSPQRAAIVWPNSSNVRKEAPVNESPRNISSRTYESAGVAARDYASPTSPDAAKASRKMKLGKVKTTLSRSNSARTHKSPATDQRPISPSSKRNTVTNVQWNEASPMIGGQIYAVASDDRQGVIASSSRGRLASLSEASSARRADVKTAENAKTDNHATHNWQPQRLYRNDEAVPTSAVIMAQGNRRSSLVRRPRTPPPVFSPKTGTFDNAPAPGSSSGHGNASTTHGILRALASKVQARRVS